MGRKKLLAHLTAAAAILSAVALTPGSCSRLEVNELYAVRLEQAPGEGHWKAGVPLLMKAGGGNVNGRNQRMEDLERDTDVIHAGSASCHHGPPVTNPVRLEARAYYSGRKLYLEVRWEDPTFDTAPRRWEKGSQGWALGEADQDGVAILWTRVAGTFGCQEACHMKDFSLRQGELVDLRAMFMAGEEEWEETWVWKSAHGSQALILTDRGFLTADERKVYRKLNSFAAEDSSLSPEARRSSTFGDEDRPLVDESGDPVGETAVAAPAYLYSGAGGGGGLSVSAERMGREWRVVFSRAMDGGEERQNFMPGQRYRFGVAVFDSTSTNHHMVRDIQVLHLVERPELPGSEGDDSRRGGEGIL